MNGTVAPDDGLAGAADAPVTRGVLRDPLFVLLLVINLLNYIDRLAVNGLLEPIRKEFGATDADMGLVGLAFLLTYATLPPVFGWLGDRTARTRVIAASATFWSLATVFTGLTRGVGQLAVARAAVGVGEASYMANAPSLIADLYPSERRGRALSLFFTALPVGAALGVAIGGLLASHYGWRVACVLVGIPGLLAAWLIARSREPLRGRFDELHLSGTVPRRAAAGDTTAARPSAREIGAYLLGNRVFVLLTLAEAGLIFAQNAVEFWLPTVLQRDKGIPLMEANSTYGAMVLVAGIVGPLIGAGVGDLLRKRDRHAYYHVSALAGFLLTAPLTTIALTSQRVPLFASVFGEALLGNLSVGLLFALVMDVLVPEVRATATAVMLTVGHALGDVISQPLVGRISTWLEQVSPTGAFWTMLTPTGIGAPQHLVVALSMVTIPAAVLTGIAFLMASRAAQRRVEPV